ncbi:hypothetical protein OUZ56_005200 [Daphnia magna]|uniref:Uncharacterized protein n=1 Tax=Daphnia magna TaxID=35525 RepID=A0ABQ9YS45_9CRUS|nr:hypothetical protein OUZ56_005200 [Daphnia magna]
MYTILCGAKEARTHETTAAAGGSIAIAGSSGMKTDTANDGLRETTRALESSNSAHQAIYRGANRVTPNLYRHPIPFHN